MPQISSPLLGLGGGGEDPRPAASSASSAGGGGWMPQLSSPLLGLGGGGEETKPAASAASTGGGGAAFGWWPFEAEPSEHAGGSSASGAPAGGAECLAAARARLGESPPPEDQDLWEPWFARWFDELRRQGFEPEEIEQAYATLRAEDPRRGGAWPPCRAPRGAQPPPAPPLPPGTLDRALEWMEEHPPPPGREDWQPWFEEWLAWARGGGCTEAQVAALYEALRARPGEPGSSRSKYPWPKFRDACTIAGRSPGADAVDDGEQPLSPASGRRDEAEAWGIDADGKLIYQDPAPRNAVPTWYSSYFNFGCVRACTAEPPPPPPCGGFGHAALEAPPPPPRGGFDSPALEAPRS
ncbi:unnamed protein product [Prorocentrum cordatum]|uniref:Selenoprotein O n=1 Tax=Prorocentrum cordatum TaxID=2364126 RepID=A0ABN9QQC9_9DINO|nr:unnamed protein product [Polarella glacialis]